MEGRTGLPMNVAIDDGFAYDIQHLPVKCYALEHIAENDLYSDQIANDLILGGEAASGEAVAGLNRKVDDVISQNER